MGIGFKVRKYLAAAAAFAVCAGAVCTDFPAGTETDIAVIAEAASEVTDTRFVVDINANDGRKASYTKTAENWIVPGDTTASTTINALTFTLSSGGSVGTGIRSVNYKVLQKSDGTTPTMTMDGVTIQDGDSGGVIKLEISGLSAGTHSLKTWHSCVDNASASTLSVSINGKTTASGVSCPTRVTNPDDAGMSYSTFNVSAGQTVTVLISPEGNGSLNNAWLNGFEIDGADPFNGISRISPADGENHLDIEDGLSWTAGNGAKSHDIYIGTDFASVYSADKSSLEYKGSQTGTNFALDDSYSSIETYYWRVDEVSDSGVTRGAVYTFKVNRLAFPTAEGYGRYARGGRGGRIVEVTNLNDSGEGSLRQALEVEKGPRIVVFKVGGVIELQSRLCIPEDGGDVYVAGQTAPGDGITLINYDFGAMGSSDVVIRNIRVRVGDMNGKSTGGMGLASCNQSIIDHCSISWATDEGFSSRNAQNISFQWNIIGESLNESVHYNADNRDETEPHSFAASISGYTGSFHHNLLIDCTGRNWSLAGGLENDAKTYGGQVDIRNNVVYNWRDRTTDGGVRRLNFVNNYYKAGEVSNTNMHIVSTDGNESGTSDVQKMYVSGNMMVAKDGSVLLKSTDNAWDKGKAVSAEKNCTTADVRSDTPFFESYVETESAEDAYNSVVAGAGANAQGWDYIDSRYIWEVTNTSYKYTGSKAGLKGIIDSQNDAGGYPNESNFEHSTAAPTDTDHDGMPDEWETEHGLNPNDASDGPVVSLSADDYTNVEMYLNELAGDPVEYNGTTLKEGTVIDTAHKYLIKNAGSGLYLELESDAANGTVVQQGNTGINGWTLTDAGDGYYKIYSEAADGKTYLLDIDYGKTDNGTKIGIWGDTNCDAQSFKFVANDDGTYTIVTKPTQDKSCLGVTSGSTEAGADVVQWTCDGTANQKWILEIKIDPLEGKLIKNLVVKDKTYYTYWGIDESIAVGDPVFGDRPVTYTVLPDELVGAEAILTACDSKKTDAELAEFTAGADITVYLAFDNRVNPTPAWIADWTKTGATAESSNPITYDLYKKSFKAGETVTLGTNGQSASCVNYTVFAVEESDEPVKGDVNLDGSVNVADAVKLQQHLIRSGELTAEQMSQADLIEDGTLNIFDMIAIRRSLIV
ncbi:MAG: RICIN domain-containing protein [Ruminococcus sp.]|nr:RICIN domain-containing protein [Ruminococcus sp.]